MVVQRKPPIIRGPFLPLHLAKKELKKVAQKPDHLNHSLPYENFFSTSRMIIEIVDGIVQDNAYGEFDEDLSN